MLLMNNNIRAYIIIGDILSQSVAFLQFVNLLLTRGVGGGGGDVNNYNTISELIYQGVYTNCFPLSLI